MQADSHRCLSIARLVTVAAEQSVPQGQMKAEIAIRFVTVNRMVDAVHLGGYQQPAQTAFESIRKADVGVCEQRTGAKQ